MNIAKTLFELLLFQRNRKLTRPEMCELQKQKLRKLLQYTWENSAYYRQKYQQAGITRQQLNDLSLSALPAIDKTELMENFDSLITVSDITQEKLRQFDADSAFDRSAFMGRYHVVHSSGSTGTPCYFLYDEDAWRRMLLGIIRGGLWNMSMPQILRLLASKPKVLYAAATEGRYGGAMAVGDGIDEVGVEQMHLDVNLPLSQWLQRIREFQPNVIIGYPSAIKILAELTQSGELKFQMKRVISCGEPLASNLRSFFEDTFRCPIINIYGASESLALGVETGVEDGIILFDDLNIIETAEDGIYLTCLYNYAQPLIRYRISDHLVQKTPMPGSPFSRAEILLSRNEDLFWFEKEDGQRDFLHPLSVEGFCIPGLLDYQFRQNSSKSFTMLAETTEKADRTFIREEMHRQMRRILAEKELDYVDFLLEFVDSILPNPKTGKKSLIIPMESKEAGV